jgi:two-component system phosphate regulon sensor histidine kinase PhoR
MNKDLQIKKLEEQNEVLENYFRNTIIPQLFIDADLILRKFTPAAMKQFKLSPDDIGKSIRDVINNLRFPSIIENIQYVIDTTEILEKEIQTTDLRWYQMNILPYVKRIDNKTNGVIITFVEITRRIKDLKEQEKLIADHETLIDTISHDMKNPLTNLLLSVELLNDGAIENPNTVKHILKIIENGIRKLQDIINDLTETRKGQQHKYEAFEELLNLEHIIEDVRLILLDTIKESGAVIKSELNVSEIFFSWRKIRSIIQNLVNNAIKFRSPERKPEIFIRSKKEDDYIILSIQDNGIGIDAAKYEDIFEKYYRIDNAVEGSGIGLHLVKELVTNAGGKILVESQVGKGTVFTIYLKAK